MNIRKWEVSSINKERAAQLAEQHSLPFFLAMLLEIRGFVTPVQIESLLSGEESLSDPFLMKGMTQAVARIRRAVDEFEKISVYGDYDADGITATSMLFTYLEALGADVMYYIPQREGEGYGMNLGAVETLHEAGVRLIITVDNGISSVEEVELARKLGIDVVITDHHRPHAVLPNAVAVIDPYQERDASPFRDFSGAGVVLKLLMALEDGEETGILEEYADLAALGTIGDVVPLLGENRAIVKAGLTSLARGGRLGLDALMERCVSADRAMTANSLAFTAIPRINATGRMGAPERAVRLLISDDEEEAQDLAEEICRDNEERRRVESEISAQAMSQIEGDSALQYSRVIVVWGDEWHHGVIGIVASRITERYGKPCFVISRDGEVAKGSGRSVGEFSLFDAVSSCADVLERYGGHPMAAGITLKAEQIPAFINQINAYAREAWPEMPAQELHLDCKLNPASLTVQMPQSLEMLEPFGNANPQPLFGLFGMTLSQILPVGSGNHLRLTCARNGATVNCMRFGMRQEEFPFRVGAELDLAVTLEVRDFRGEPQITIQIRDMKLSGIDTQLSIHSFRVYEKLKRQEAFTQEENALLLPSRSDLAVLYRLFQPGKSRIYNLQALLRSKGMEAFSMGKLLLCLDMLEESGLIVRQWQGDCVRIELVQTQEKVNLFASPAFLSLVELSEKR